MGKWLRDNWFKVSLLCICILVGGVLIYYFAWQLPKKNMQEIVIKQNSEYMLLEEKCSLKADEFMASHYYTGKEIGIPKDSYTSHFNKRLSKCFVYFNRWAPPQSPGDKGLGWAGLFDAYEGREYAKISYGVDNKSEEWTDGHILDKENPNYDEFKKFVKPYMEN